MCLPVGMDADYMLVSSVLLLPLLCSFLSPHARTHTSFVLALTLDTKVLAVERVPSSRYWILPLRYLNTTLSDRHSPFLPAE